MAKLKSIRTDLKKSLEGIWENYAGIDFLIAKKPNPKYEAKLEKLSEPYVGLIRRNQLAKEKDRELTMRAVIGTVLLGWKNLEDDNGKAIKFTETKAFEILSDPQYEDLYNWILVTSHSVALFRIEDDEEGRGN